MNDVATRNEIYKKAYQEGLDEAIKRISSFKNMTVLEIRLEKFNLGWENSISDEYYEFACKLIDAQIKLLSMKGS